MFYFTWEIKENQDEEGNKLPIIVDFNIEKVANCMLLLPELDDSGYQSGISPSEICYTMIDWNWKQINKKGVMEI